MFTWGDYGAGLCPSVVTEGYRMYSSENSFLVISGTVLN